MTTRSSEPDGPCRSRATWIAGVIAGVIALVLALGLRVDIAVSAAQPERTEAAGAPGRYALTISVGRSGGPVSRESQEGGSR